MKLEEAITQLFPDPSLLTELDKLRVQTRGRVKGSLAGKRRSTSLGGSQEFADYRPYSPGDDVRRIDWNVYGRTGRAYMRQYWDEQELHIHLYVDISPSMANFGGELGNKLQYALRLAACVGYSALIGDDRLSVKLFTEHAVERDLLSLQGRAGSMKLFTFLAAAMQERDRTSDRMGTSDLTIPLLKHNQLIRRSGTTWLFTDAWFEEGLEQTLIGLTASKQQVVFVHLLSQEEIHPNYSGELKLVDSELGTGKEAAMSSKLIANYRKELAAYQEYLRKLCSDIGAEYVCINTNIALHEAIVKLLVTK